MTRLLKHHLVSGQAEELQVHVIDEPGHGGANHEYIIAAEVEGETAQHMLAHIRFQNGPIATTGVNGVTHEALLAILIDRLDGFQSGPCACPENADALRALQEAMGALQSRTHARIARGVEGTHTV